MKKFTVKDFIAYNNPCFGCGKNINFKIGFYSNNEMGKAWASYLRPSVLANYTEIDLKITYSDAVKLYIFHKTNKILTNNQAGLTKYLTEHKLFLSSTCQCQTTIETGPMDFHLLTENQFVSAVPISFEMLLVRSQDNIYQLTSSFPDNKSTLNVWKAEDTYIKYGKLKPQLPSQATTIEMPLIPKYKFKNKEHFLEKMKTYILFS